MVHPPRPPGLDLKSPSDLTRAVLAMQAVRAARAFLPLIRLQTDSHCRAILFGALCGYYARPFTNNHGLGMLSPKVVPDELSSTHDKLLLYRHKIAAHSDSGHGHEGVAVNSVFFRSNGAHVVVEDRHVSPSSAYLVEVETLLHAVGARLSEAVGRCLNSGPASTIAYPVGLYQLRGDGEQNWNFVAVPDDGLDGDGTIVIQDDSQ